MKQNVVYHKGNYNTQEEEAIFQYISTTTILVKGLYAKDWAKWMLAALRFMQNDMNILCPEELKMEWMKEMEKTETIELKEDQNVD